MAGLRICILDDHGDPLEGWFLHTHGWMLASNMWVGIIGARPRMREVLAFMSTGTSYSILTLYCLNPVR